MLLCCIGAKAQQMQPKTRITFQVSAVQEKFYAGPYAEFAQKYLGVEARSKDSSKATLTSVVMNYGSEADASGVSVWSKPGFAKAGFESKGLTSNYTSEAATLYSAGSASRLVSQSMTVQKTPDQKAREAADMIFNLRRNRIQIITGDTDATYSGEAMGAAIAEISRMEAEYLSMFIGYSEYQNQKMNYDVVPAVDSKKQIYVAFRLSDAEGLVPADNVSGKPYVLELVPQPITAAPASRGAASRGTVAYYRIPAICTAKLSDGVNVLLQSRIPVYQLGIESSFPISEK